MAAQHTPQSSKRVNGKPIRQCPWCGGGLRFHARYPVHRLIPGTTVRGFNDDLLAGATPTCPAWACETPHCRFREPA